MTEALWQLTHQKYFMKVPTYWSNTELNYKLTSEVKEK
jgi:hypothetical protein